jgi:hypothetical protein
MISSQDLLPNGEFLVGWSGLKHKKEGRILKDCDEGWMVKVAQLLRLEQMVGLVVTLEGEERWEGN